ncbi:MAG TPA: tRNA guanosine(34) transglycosylase Tgt [Haliangiales bacterium]|nr:tRNA guanosine(34) transglycosylase Tgt [Haliangiales bacterium]
MTAGFSFRVVGRRGHARAGVVTTPRGEIETPMFMPLATTGTVKALTAGELRAPPLDARLVLGNTYHLYLRPGLDVIQAVGGLHAMMDWDRPILTDSGGFQVFSLGDLAAVDDDGVTFRSHIDGTPHRFTPERSMEIQAALGSDIAMAFDQLPSGDASRERMLAAMARTAAWARRCLEVDRPAGQALFGILQGGANVDLRRRHLDEIGPLPFDGMALGGFSVGEPIPAMYETLDAMAHELPEAKPRYLMGVGTPEDIERAVAAGVDLFDCALPTRNARNGQLFTSQGKIVISNAKYRMDAGPIDPECPCDACARTSRAYLRHLFMSREILYSRLATLHNVTYYLRWVRRLRREILA